MIAKHDFWNSLNPFDVKARMKLLPYVLVFAGVVSLIALVLQVLKVVAQGS